MGRSVNRDLSPTTPATTDHFGTLARKSCEHDHLRWSLIEYGDATQKMGRIRALDRRPIAARRVIFCLRHHPLGIGRGSIRTRVGGFCLENIDRVVFVPISGGLAAWVGWGWRSWIRRRPEQLSLGMRCSLGGFVLASVSVALEIGSGIYALIIGSMYGQFENVGINRWGFLLAFLGLVTGLFGVANKTPLRWKAPALSTVLLLVFFVQLLGQPIA